ncbi:phage-related tail fiber protein [Photorhabdus khanii NC19]|uniref:Phage-related tail fiber protein n=1 Tax=Photorhabdus khanii NC19 TaxID=1004151 RepID=W3V7K2_9GAMM|nr:phage tail protein [Photorhabdus khanii]ETS31793.1 phage-related tail fiber protein [Photorhabdus khanii NC19]
MKYFAILTKMGAAKLANAAALGTKVDITHMAVGDGGGQLPSPDVNQTQLINEKRRAAINTLSVDPVNTNQIIAEQIIPEGEGGWWMREIGLFDSEGNMIAVANCPETYKPQLQEGSGRTQTVRMILIVSNTDSVTLKIDPSIVLATREYVDSSIQKHEKSRNHPDATLTEKGFTKLNSATNSNDETTAATPKAVKAAYDLAAKINTNALAKNQNGADIPDKNAFVKNLGLLEKLIPVGVPLPWPTATPPDGWVQCNGAAFDKSLFPELAKIYPGGNLPDLRGEFIRGWDSGRGVDPSRSLLVWQEGSYLVQEVGQVDNVVNFSLNDRVALQWDAPDPKNKAISLRARTVGSATTWTANTGYIGASRPRNVAFNYIVRAA